MTNSGREQSIEVCRLITHNAIDFLRRSIKEFDKLPKYSIIHFATSMELFLKARLAFEHWTLIVEGIDHDKFSYERLIAGEAKTVSAENARGRIKKILQHRKDDRIEDKAFDSFGALARCRNKIIHFNFATLKDVQVKIAALQCRSWFYLYGLLGKQWLPVFVEIQKNEDFQKQIDAINKLMQKQKKYLAVKFEELKPKIDQRKNEGWAYSDCSSCGHGAFRHSFEIKSLKSFSGMCEVCDTGYPWLHCPDCKADTYMYIRHDETSRCHKCKHEFTVADVFTTQDVCDFEKRAYILNDIYGSSGVWCNECETETVDISGNWFCTSCEEWFCEEDVATCKYCNEQIAGGGGGEDVGDYFGGCNLCGGKYGELMAKDD